MEIYDTHKFLFTLNYEGNAKGHEVEFIDRDNNEKKITLEKIDITSSPVSCKLYDCEGNKYLVPFIRIRRVFKDKEMVWDNSDTDLSNVKVIKGFD